jgi:hypothetical protein
LTLLGRNWLILVTITETVGWRIRTISCAEESATALRRNIAVVPILVEGAKVPKADRLPMDLQELEQRKGLVRHVSFHRDMDKLCRWL